MGDSEDERERERDKYERQRERDEEYYREQSGDAHVNSSAGVSQVRNNTVTLSRSVKEH